MKRSRVTEECSSDSLSSSDSDFEVDRQQKRKQTYLEGRAHKPYRVVRDLSGPSSSDRDDLTVSNVCNSCMPVLCKYAETFKGLKRQGSELKRCKRVNPNPKRADFDHYRDLRKQNEWLRNNAFDTLGNYLFCSKCIHNALGVSYQRLARQRKVKRAQFHQPIRRMTKQEVAEKNLSQYVVMPEGSDLSFMLWRKSLGSGDTVQVRYPHHLHGLAGMPSNSSKPSAKQDFLQFVDSNSQPNGRSADSASATHYLLPKFRTIQTPKKGVCRYDERVMQSLVGEFNRVQNENGRQTISNYSGSEWLKHERPKHAIYPHKKDYCDTCAKIKLAIQSKQMSLTRMREAGSSSEAKQRQLESEVAALQLELETHREHALKSHEYYTEATAKCKQKWKEIADLEGKEERTDEEEENLAQLKHCFNAVISADYQMSKLVPSWGLSPQPGSTYYLQKLSNDILE